MEGLSIVIHVFSVIGFFFLLVCLGRTREQLRQRDLGVIPGLVELWGLSCRKVPDEGRQGADFCPFVTNPSGHPTTVSEFMTRDLKRFWPVLNWLEGRLSEKCGRQVNLYVPPEGLDANGLRKLQIFSMKLIYEKGFLDNFPITHVNKEEVTYDALGGHWKEDL